MTSNPYQSRPGSKRYNIAKRLLSGMSPMEVYAEIKPLVLRQSPPWIWKANNPVKGLHRVPKPIGEQLVEMKNEVNRVLVDMGRKNDRLRRNIDPDAAPEDPETNEDEDEPEDVIPEPEPVKVQASGKLDYKAEIAWFVSEWRRIRKHLKSEAEKGNAVVDNLDSMRPVLDAKKAILHNIPAKALIHSMTVSWSKVTRDNAGIQNFDPETISPKQSETHHKLTGYCLKIARAGIPLMLVGPSGTGKSHIATQIAEILELPYGETPISAGATRGDLLGRHTLGGEWKIISDNGEFTAIGNGFIQAQFPQIYTGGGVFNFEEIDAAEANTLLVLNNAIAGGKLYNSADGQVYDKHPDFIPVSTANTWGIGADKEYVGRAKLDFATRDRWRMGRVFVTLDEDLVDALMEI